MPSTTLALNGATPVLFALPSVAGRVVVTMLSAPATAYITADGSYPLIPSVGVVNPGGLFTLAGWIGAQASIPCPLFGDHMAIPTLRFASDGSPVVHLDW